jgi:hypothetical protein
VPSQQSGSRKNSSFARIKSLSASIKGTSCGRIAVLLGYFGNAQTSIGGKN